MQKQFLQTFKIIILGLVLGIGVNYISAAWTPAPASPPNSNVDAPLNVGPDDQIKAGIVASDGTCTAPKCGGLTVGILSVVGKALFQNPIQINAGSPGPGKVLTSTDARGNAEWRSLSGTAGSLTATSIYGPYTSPKIDDYNGNFSELTRIPITGAVLPKGKYIVRATVEAAIRGAGSMEVTLTINGSTQQLNYVKRRVTNPELVDDLVFTSDPVYYDGTKAASAQFSAVGGIMKGGSFKISDARVVFEPILKIAPENILQP